MRNYFLIPIFLIYKAFVDDENVISTRRIAVGFYVTTPQTYKHYQEKNLFTANN